jgi:preprotein translocase subunit SecF
MKFREIVKKTKVDFIGLRNKSFILSAILVLLGLTGFVMVWAGKANLSVDFTGGTNLQIAFSGPVTIGELRAALARGDMPDAQIQQVSGKNEFFVKTVLVNTSTARVQDKVGKILTGAFPGKTYQVLRSDMVGSSVGRAFKKSSIIAIVLSLLGIIIYIAWRFNFTFGVAATIATFHDVLVLLGIFWVFGFEMNILFITALLTIAGYSLTDTVVVYDRIRENMAKMKSRADLANTINVSINEVLSRTLITSLTTLIAAGSILAVGGANLFDFSFALFVGVLVGTYSSIFVASPLIYLWKRKA